MPRKSRHIPRYCHHKPTGQARVRIDGKDYWLGKYGAAESWDRYDEVISKHVIGEVGRSERLTVSQLLALFWRHAKRRYGRSGKGRFGAAVNWRPIIRLVRIRFGDRQVGEFDPLSLSSLLDDMIEKEWSRNYANEQIKRVRKIFKWGVSQSRASSSDSTLAITKERNRQNRPMRH